MSMLDESNLSIRSTYLSWSAFLFFGVAFELVDVVLGRIGSFLFFGVGFEWVDVVLGRIGSFLFSGIAFVRVADTLVSARRWRSEAHGEQCRKDGND